MRRDHWTSRSRRALRQRWAGFRHSLRGRTHRIGTIIRAQPTRWVAGGIAVVLAAGAPVAVMASLDGERSALPAATGGGATSPTPAAEGGVSYAPVPGLNRPGVHLSVAANTFGEVEVVEHILVDVPIIQLSVSPPPSAAGSGSSQARLEDLQVSADGVPVAVADDVAAATPLALMQPTTRVELRYRVVGAVSRSQPATPGRATLSLRPASAAALGDTPTVVEVHGSVVHNLVCVDAEVERQLCGIDDSVGWRTRRLTASASHVLALVDLPDPTA